MATVEQKEEVEEVRTLLGRMRPLYKEYAAALHVVNGLAAKMRSFETDMVILCNAQDAMERRMREAEIQRAKVEQEAKTRIQSIEHGSRTLTDNLSRKELEADAAKAAAEKTQRAADAARHEYELLKDAYENKIAELSAAHPKKK